MSQLINRIFFAISMLLLCGCVSKIDSIINDHVRILDEGSGYLFLTIDSDIRYSDIRISGPQNFELLKPSSFEGKNYYLLEIPAGKYSIDHVREAWGGKYRLNDDEDKELWSFQVNPGVISYVGELKVRRVLYSYSKFELVNNSSLALEFLDQNYPNILANRTLEYHGPGIDFFYQLVSKKKPDPNTESAGEEL